MGDTKQPAEGSPSGIEDADAVSCDGLEDGIQEDGFDPEDIVQGYGTMGSGGVEYAADDSLYNDGERIYGNGDQSAARRLADDHRPVLAPLGATALVDEAKDSAASPLSSKRKPERRASKSDRVQKRVKTGPERTTPSSSFSPEPPSTSHTLVASHQHELIVGVHDEGRLSTLQDQFRLAQIRFGTLQRLAGLRTAQSRSLAQKLQMTAEYDKRGSAFSWKQELARRAANDRADALESKTESLEMDLKEAKQQNSILEAEKKSLSEKLVAQTKAAAEARASPKAGGARQCDADLEQAQATVDTLEKAYNQRKAEAEVVSLPRTVDAQVQTEAELAVEQEQAASRAAMEPATGVEADRQRCQRRVCQLELALADAYAEVGAARRRFVQVCSQQDEARSEAATATTMSKADQRDGMIVAETEGNQWPLSELESSALAELVAAGKRHDQLLPQLQEARAEAAKAKIWADERDRLIVKIEALTRKLEDAQQKIAAATAERDTAERDHNRQAIKDRTAERERDRQTIAKLTAERDRSLQATKVLTAERDQSRQAIKDLTAEREHGRQKLAELTAQRERDRQKIADVTAERDQSRQAMKDLAAEQEHDRKKIAELTAERDRSQQAIKDLTAERERDEQKMTELIAERDRTSEDFRQTNERLSAFHAEYTKLYAEYNANHERLSQAYKDRKELLSEVRRLKAERGVEELVEGHPAGVALAMLRAASQNVETSTPGPAADTAG